MTRSGQTPLLRLGDFYSFATSPPLTMDSIVNLLPLPTMTSSLPSVSFLIRLVCVNFFYKNEAKIAKILILFYF